MNKFLISVTAMAALGAQTAVSQSRSFISGFELGSLAEGSGNGGTVEPFAGRSGSYAYRANPTYANHHIVFQSRSAGGGLRQIFKSSRFYLKVASLPISGSVALVKVGGAATFNPEVDLNSDGTLTLADSWYPSIARSAKHLTADGAWHLIEFAVGDGLSVHVDGELWAQGGSGAYPAGTAIILGAGPSKTTVNTTADLYFDDLLVDSGSARIGPGHAVLLKPTADPANLNSWTNGGGGTSSLWMPVANVPANGRTPANSNNMTQIKNTKAGSNQDYKPSVQTYASAGVTGFVNAVMALSNDGQENTKGQAKAGAVWIDQNPAQAAGYSFDFGDRYYAIGNFPAGWISHGGPVTSNPAVNLNAAPVVAVRKSSGSGVHVDFLGVYVDYR